MRIPSFSVQNSRSVRLARCDSVPPFMLIAGPNGAEKSTLLDGIRSTSGWQNIVYLGPHRAMRRQSVQERHLLAHPFVFEELLARPDSPQFEGIALITG